MARLRQLEKALGAAFKAPTPKKPDMQRGQREEATPSTSGASARPWGVNEHAQAPPRYQPDCQARRRTGGGGHSAEDA